MPDVTETPRFTVVVLLQKALNLCKHETTGFGRGMGKHKMHSACFHANRKPKYHNIASHSCTNTEKYKSGKQTLELEIRSTATTMPHDRVSNYCRGFLVVPNGKIDSFVLVRSWAKVTA